MVQEGTYERIISVARSSFNDGKTRPISFRVAQLKKFIQMLEESRGEIEQALSLDLHKHKMETTLFEVEGIIHEAKVLINDMKKNANPDVLPFNLLGAMDKGTIEKVPYGLVLIMGAWNYPFLLSLVPMIGAIAAGNCVILKPSEITERCANLMARMITKYLDNSTYFVIEANPEETQHLLKFKFDYIFYTGSTNVGRLVASAAAIHLTPTTLELGGKSPCYVDDESCYEIATKRILWGRLVNSGQTCIAPDFLLCSKKVENEFIQVAQKVLKEWFEGNPQTSESYGRIVNEKHCMRLKQLLATTQGKIVIGGRVDVDDRYVEPTVVVDVTIDDPLMQEEIFGPILPIVSVKSVSEAIDIINSRPRPLALYAFSKNDKTNNLLKDHTISGGVCLNDTLWHAVWNGLPFGGVGESGMGHYHGKSSFLTFSHERSVLSRSFSRISEKLGEDRYAPYNDSKIRMLSFIIKHFLKFDIRAGPIISHGVALLVGAAIVAAVFLSK